MANNIRNKIGSLPGSYSEYGDGNLGRADKTSFAQPKIVIMGTGERGLDHTPHVLTANNIDSASKIFGNGTLLLQIQEAQAKGLDSCIAIRQCSIPPFISGIGSTSTLHDNGVTIEARTHIEGFGTRFSILWKQSNKHLKLIDNLTQTTVYDNEAGNYVDLGVFNITGTYIDDATNHQDDINHGGPNEPILVKDIDITGDNAARKLYLGSSEYSPTLMRLFEGTFKSFASLEGFPHGVIAMPPRATLNAPSNPNAGFSENPNAGTPIDAITGSPSGSGNTYPVAGTPADTLGKVYIEYIDDKYEFYWDVDNDGTAEYWTPRQPWDTNSTYAGTSKGGKVFSSDDFLEPNFGHMLAYHCSRTTYEENYVQGVIAVEAPDFTKPISKWVGELPTFATASDGIITVSTNGTGLLGEKHLAGSTSFRDKEPYGGFIETTEPYFYNGPEQKDFNDQPVDIGKFLTIWITPEAHVPAFGANNNITYTRISPVAYSSWREQLSLTTTPTQKPYPAASGIYTGRLNRSQQAALTALRYTFAVEDGRGIRVLDSPTAARPESDYTRQNTINIVQYVDNTIRAVSNQFIGKTITATEEIAFQTELDEAIAMLQKIKIIKSGRAKVIITARDRSLGQASVQIKIEVPFEIRQISFNLNLMQGS